MNFYDVLAAKNWSGGIPTTNFFDLLFAQSMGGGEQWQTYDGTLPATLNANGSDMRQYQIWGNTGGVGEPTGNLFDKNNIEYPAYVRANGTINRSSGATGYAISDYISVETGDYVAHGLQSRGNLPHIAVYDENKELVRTVQIISSQDMALTIESNEKYVRLSVRMAEDEYQTAMFTRGDTAPETFVPFGYEVDMGVKSANNFNADIVRGNIRSTNGENLISATRLRSDFEGYMLPAGTYTISAHGVDNVSTRAYNSSKDYVAEASIAEKRQKLPLTFTLNNDYYMRFVFRRADDSNIYVYDISNIMLNVGSTALPYEPYSNTTTPIYIGNEPLEKDEYVDFGEQKIYRMINSTLTPTDPPVPLPALPTAEGTTIIDYVGQSVAPEKVLLEYVKGGN